MAKTDVNGVRTHPVYKWLKEQTDPADIKWNFETKFLISADGKAVKRFSSAYDVDRLRPEIEAMLEEAIHNSESQEL